MNMHLLCALQAQPQGPSRPQWQQGSQCKAWAKTHVQAWAHQPHAPPQDIKMAAGLPLPPTPSLLSAQELVAPGFPQHNLNNRGLSSQKGTAHLHHSAMLVNTIMLHELEFKRAKLNSNMINTVHHSDSPISYNMVHSGAPTYLPRGGLDLITSSSLRDDSDNIITH